MTQSKGEARRAVAEGGIYLNNRRVTDPAQVITPEDLLEGHFLVIRRGRKNYHLIKDSRLTGLSDFYRRSQSLLTWHGATR